jgi:hypothetical protein
LFSTVVKHAASVAGADVVTLTVQLGWIVQGKEDVQNYICGDNRLVEDNSGDFSVAGSLTADSFIAGVFNMTPAIANLDIADATKLHKA